MEVNVTSTSTDRKVSWVNWISEPIKYSSSLGIREFKSLDEAFKVLQEETGEDQYVVIFSENEIPEIEIYNNYRE